MKKIIKNKKLEIGQVIPLVVLMMFAIIAMVALILDGGSLMSNRRTAQAAADAGALAGTQVLCTGGSVADAEDYAIQYATYYNDASSATANAKDFSVTVVSTVENPSFFAKIFGIQTLEARAEAVATCSGPMGFGVLPVAWKCWENVGGPYVDEYDCELQTLSWPLIEPLVKGSVNSIVISNFFGVEKNYELITEYDNKNKLVSSSILDANNIPPEQIYIIMNTDKLCLEDNPVTGQIYCDTTGDTKKDIQTGGNRGWLYLTATTSNIKVSKSEPPVHLQPHTWLSGKPGGTQGVFDDLIDEGYVGEVILVPVYNEFCPGDPRTDQSCINAAHKHPPWPLFTGQDILSEISKKSDNYHIIAFSPFYLTCVAKNDGNCPGFRNAQKINADKGITLANDSVIEGFFLSDYPISIDFSQGCLFNLGNCDISLTK